MSNIKATYSQTFNTFSGVDCQLALTLCGDERPVEDKEYTEPIRVLRTVQSFRWAERVRKGKNITKGYLKVILTQQEEIPVEYGQGAYALLVHMLNQYGATNAFSIPDFKVTHRSIQADVDDRLVFVRYLFEGGPVQNYPGDVWAKTKTGMPFRKV